MAKASALRRAMLDGGYDALLTRLYGEEHVKRQRQRYADTVTHFIELYGDEEACFFSAPGRTEIGGNHTDHNHGRVLAGSVDLDVIAVAAKAADELVITSEGFGTDTVPVGEWIPVESETGHSAALVRGVAARFHQLGLHVGGLKAYTTSDVLKGSGLSSSAAFEVLLGTMLATFYNDGTVSPVTVAQVAQYAENVYFGKPCGLMDQTASAVGGIITIDFADPAKPIIRQVPFDFATSGYALCIVDTGGCHADLTPDYASVPAEMKTVANQLGVEFLRDTDRQAVIDALPTLRERCGDRAVLRAFHFLEDNQRVADQVAALEAGDFDRFLALIIESGHSSFEYLQNVWTTKNVTEQGLSLALCLAESVLAGCGGWRVHGGGFAGTTQNFVPLSKLSAFTALMDAAFGPGHCYILRIRPYGGICLDTVMQEVG
ncbi:MAG: galactokinase [Clostridia bacterium]|nr:galactokinase [Clostridia bacterium]